MAVNTATLSNEAVIENGATVNANGVTLMATMSNGDDGVHSLTADAVSGAGAEEIGLAGSLAVNIADTRSESVIESAALVDAGGGGVELISQSALSGDFEKHTFVSKSVQTTHDKHTLMSLKSVHDLSPQLIVN